MQATRENFLPAVPKVWRVSRRVPLGLLLAAGIASLFLSACGARTDSFTLHGEALGTFYTITVASPPATVNEAGAGKIAADTLSRVNGLMSTYLEESELSRFNRDGQDTPFPVSGETYKVFEMAQTISEQSGGAFDITVGPLVNAWGFGPDIFKNPPAEEEVVKLLERTGYQKVALLPESSLAKSQPDVYCDLSAIAKGYAVDAVAEAFEQAGITNYMIEVGGEIRVAGKSPKAREWTLGIEAPKYDSRELYTAVSMGQGALATSGDYRNMYEYKGQLVSHTIDPKTGHPVQHGMASVSVIHPSCAWADGYATAIMALGPEKGYAFALENDLAVLLLVREAGSNAFKELSTPKFDACRKTVPAK